MNTEVTLKKSATLPPFLQEVFKRVDKKAFDELNDYFADDFRLYFAHYVLRGNVMGDIFVGDNITTFDGILRVWLEDDSVVETPFWDKIEVDPTSGKITTMYALFSIAAVPERFWKDLKPEDFAPTS